MGFFGSFTGQTQASAASKAAQEYKDTLLKWQGAALNNYNSGFDGARRDITNGISAAHNALNAAGDNARRDLTQGYGDAISTARAGLDRISSLYAPYIESGSRAQDFYDTALGLDGQDAQRQFYDNYAANDPFREFRDEQANRSILAQANAAGMGGVGGMANIANGAGGGRTALAVARGSLERGTQDLNDYLNRLEGQATRGGAYAGQLSGFIDSGTGRIAGYQSQQGRDLGQLEQLHGRSLADLYTNNRIGDGTISMARGQTLGDLDMNVGNALATNNANREIAKGQAKAMGANNLLGVATAGLKLWGGQLPGGFGSSTTPGTAANGGWTTTTTPTSAEGYWNMWGSR